MLNSDWFGSHFTGKLAPGNSNNNEKPSRVKPGVLIIACISKCISNYS